MYNIGIKIVVKECNLIMQINYMLTTQDIIDYNIYIMNTSKTMKSKLAFNRYIIIPGICLLFMLFLIVNLSYTLFECIPFILICVIVMALYPTMQMIIYKKHIFNMLKENNNKDMFAECTLLINEEGLTRTSKYKQSLLRWIGVCRVEVTNKHIFIFESGLNAIKVPLSAFCNSEAKDKFIKFINTYTNQKSS